MACSKACSAIADTIFKFVAELILYLYVFILYVSRVGSVLIYKPKTRRRGLDLTLTASQLAFTFYFI